MKCFVTLMLLNIWIIFFQAVNSLLISNLKSRADINLQEGKLEATKVDTRAK